MARKATTKKKVSRKSAAVASEAKVAPKKRRVARGESLSEVYQAREVVPVRRVRILLVAGIAVLVVGVAFFLYKFLVVAWVDTTPISRLQVYNQMESRWGKDTLD